MDEPSLADLLGLWERTECGYFCPERGGIYGAGDRRFRWKLTDAERRLYDTAFATPEEAKDAADRILLRGEDT